MKKNLNIDEINLMIWDSFVVNCFEDTPIEDAVRKWLKLYKKVNPRLLGNETKRETVFEILETSGFLPIIETHYTVYRKYDHPSRSFVTCLENILASVEVAIAKELSK